MDNSLAHKYGMTLVEVIIVVTIISFLVLIAVFFVRSAVPKGDDARRKGDIQKIQLALEEYEKDHDCYPLPSDVDCNSGKGLVPYLGKIPCDPETKTSYFYEAEGGSCPNWYRIYANLVNKSDPDINNLGGKYNYYSSSPNAPAL